jgi:two-component sensor histidine kinase
MNPPTPAGFDGVVLCVGEKDAIRPARRRLQRDGRIIEHAEDSAAALARVKRGGVAAVILDHDPGPFLEFLREVNQLPDAPPVIYVTASSEISLAIEALKTGAADFVIKTAGPDFDVQLLAAFERALEMARLRREKDRAHSEAREERDRAKALLEEVNHRVANSLALVIALVRMQASATPEASAKTVLNETEARIAAVANLHRTLYASEDILVVDLEVYLRELVDELRRAIAVESLTPTLSVDAVAARIATDKAVAIGVITTELITNAIKYAYPAATGEIRLRLQPNAGAGLILSVEDDGVGFAGGREKGEGLGARIVAAMAHSLGAELQYDNRDRGTRAFLRLSEDLFIDPPSS